ncbi:MAG TPA: globin domain-containing protein [Candidatus Binatia bacterium]
MTNHDIELFNDSLQRCTSRPGFLERFYEIFTASSEKVAEKFKRTDFQKQAILLKASLYLMLLAAWKKPEGHAHLERIAQLHGRNGLDIAPELYDLWLNCLLRTVKEYDSRFNTRTKRAWYNMMQSGIKFMKSRY